MQDLCNKYFSCTYVYRAENHGLRKYGRLWWWWWWWWYFGPNNSCCKTDFSLYIYKIPSCLICQRRTGLREINISHLLNILHWSSFHFILYPNERTNEHTTTVLCSNRISIPASILYIFLLCLTYIVVSLSCLFFYLFNRTVLPRWLCSSSSNNKERLMKKKEQKFYLRVYIVEQK